MELIERLMLYEDNGSVKGSINFPSLDSVNKIVISAHSISAYLGNLDWNHLQKVATRINSDTTLWISRLFRFFDSSGCFHEEQWEGLVRLCRALIRLRYPKYDEDGFETLYSRPPVIYISAAMRNSLGKHLCNRLGLPRSSISLIPCNTVFGSQYKMDVALLQRTIQEDEAAQKVPLLVIASAGAPPLGQVDNLQRLQEVCKTHDLWLHVEGHMLAGLCLVLAPTLPAKIGDSMTLNLGSWLGLSSVPHVTLYKNIDLNVAIAAGLTATPQVKLSCLPVWISLQALGQDGVVGRIQHAFQLARRLQDQLTQLKNVRLIGKEGEKGSPNYAIDDVTTKSVSTTVLFKVLTPTVIFQYFYPGSADGRDSKLLKPSEALDDEYINSLNSWLGQILQRDIPEVNLEIIELDNFKKFLRFSPLNSSNTIHTTLEMVDHFFNTLSQQVEIMNATVNHKESFPEYVSRQPQLEVVELQEWAGLGGVRYVPEAWVGHMTDLPDTGKEEVNKVNYELVMQLKNTDAAFSLGGGADALYCVRFGMVTEDTDMEELLALIVNIGRDIEESSKYLESMTEVIKKGIQAANQDLQKENTEKIWQEGLLRHVPLVGGLYNWWSPMPSETGVKGRSFNLVSGVIESTENIYKYHMQIQEGSPKLSSAPPKPSVQTPVVSTEQSHSTAKSSVPPSPIPTDQNRQQ
ncbi:hypothetical protein CHUAL_003682 [Chamberlinius hualienensis]